MQVPGDESLIGRITGFDDIEVAQRDQAVVLLRAIYTRLQQYTERHHVPIGTTLHEKDALPLARLTNQQVMDYLNISESTYKRQVKSGILPTGSALPKP